MAQTQQEQIIAGNTEQAPFKLRITFLLGPNSSIGKDHQGKVVFAGPMGFKARSCAFGKLTPVRWRIELRACLGIVMKTAPGRRFALITMGLGLAALRDRAARAAEPSLLPPPAKSLEELSARLSSAPRRRDFKTVPMILSDPDQWDHAALSEVIAHRGSPKQVWDNTEIAGPWLSVMRNALNTQVWSFRHPDFLVVSATHGTAHLALFESAIWQKYQLAKLTEGKFQSNTLIAEPKAAAADPKDYENPEGVFSLHDDSIPSLQRRGVVFLACHNAIWELAEKLMATGANPDDLSHGALAADLTNHLIDGVVLTPGMVGTVPELQRAGFDYAYSG
jgi:hypothetical protein